MADLTLKVGDLEPELAVVLVSATGGMVDLSTGVDSVKFRFGTVDRVEVFERDAIVTNALLGKLSYVWQAGDTDVAGVYLAEFVVAWTTARPQTYPPTGYLIIVIEPKL